MLTARLLANFPFEPTADQGRLFALLGDFLLDRPAHRPTFLLTGYAGTGKTTVVTSLVQTLPQIGFDVVLLAPTGRAAKVLATYTGQGASTIHKHIYREADGEGGLSFRPMPNRASHTVYVVDEASMIADDDGAFGSRGLLADLVQFVFMDGRRNNRLLLIGDPAQLPPVGQTRSPALDAGILATRFQAAVTSCELRQVMRQNADSGILQNATALREELTRAAGPEAYSPSPVLHTHDRRGIWAMSGEKLEDGLRYAYEKFGQENTTLICRSNKQANQYNQLIRRVIFDAEDEIQGGDYLMIARNNYFWLPAGAEMGFLANGDFAEVRRVRRTEELFGFRFVDVRLRFVDYPSAPELDVKLLLDSLHAESPALPADAQARLREAVSRGYDDLPSKAKRAEALRQDPYLNALQVKFAYALTCHKAQGGQWGAVFLDHGYLKPDVPLDAEFVRWLYTAITRAEHELYLLNFRPALLGEAD